MAEITEIMRASTHNQTSANAAFSEGPPLLFCQCDFMYSRGGFSISLVDLFSLKRLFHSAWSFIPSLKGQSCYEGWLSPPADIFVICHTHQQFALPPLILSLRASIQHYSVTDNMLTASLFSAICYE